MFTSLVNVIAIDFDLNRVQVNSIAENNFVDGQLRFLAGPQTGIPFGIPSVNGAWLTLDRPIHESNTPETSAEIREGCDHTHSTCSARFGNAVNFRGEPFLPGNDLLARYGQSSG